MPADLSWRSEQLRLATIGREPVRTPSPGSGAVATLAVVGGIGWTILPFWSLGWPTAWLVGVFATWALAAALSGLVLGFQDRIRTQVAIVGSLGAAIGALSVMGLFAGLICLFLASTAVVWELGRLQILSRTLVRGHAAAAILAAALIAAAVTNIVTFNEIFALALILLFTPYGISWIVIGRSLRHVRTLPEIGASPH